MTPGAPSYLNLLLFSVAGVSFGIDTEQMLETASYRGEQADDLCWFHELLRFGAPAAVYQAPVVITVGARQGRRHRVIIDGMEEIAEFAVGDMRPLPPLYEPFCLANGIWGVLPHKEGLTLLLDLMALFAARDGEAP